jgi:hypothetical protein
MVVDDGDEFVAFQNVRVVRSTAPALLCSIAGRELWLPRMHVAGKLWCAGDRGRLLVRRWVARDRQLIAPPGHAPLSSLPHGRGEDH